MDHESVFAAVGGTDGVPRRPRWSRDGVHADT